MLFMIGMVAVALGIVGIIWGIFNHIKAGRVSDAPFAKTGEVAARGAAVASPKGAISVEGAVACPQPVMAPVSGVPCHWFHIKSTVRWKDGETEKTQQLDEQKVGARFTVDDGTGPVWVDPSQGGDFEPTQKKAQKQAATFMAGVKGEDIVFGSYRVNPGLNVGLGRSYEVEEEFMPLQSRLYVCGVVGQGNTIEAPKWRALLLHSKSRDELLGSAQKTAKMSLMGGVAALVLGSGMAVAGQVLFPADTATTQAAASANNAKKPASTATAVAPKSAPKK